MLIVSLIFVSLVNFTCIKSQLLYALSFKYSFSLLKKKFY